MLRIVHITLVVTFAILAQANEWETSRGQHCIERCQLKKQWKDEDVYACYTVDGHNTEFLPSNQHESSRPNSDGPIPSLDDDDYPWDYCIPAKITALPDEDDHDKDEEEDDHNLRPDDNEDQGGFHDGDDQGGFHDGDDQGGFHDGDNQGGFHDGDNRSEGHDSGDSGFNPGKIEESSHPSHECQSSCQKNENNAFKCDIGDGHGDFYCSPDNELKREQLSSHNRLWCIDNCDDGECRTLFGLDKCSVNKVTSSSGAKCETECKVWPEFDDKLTCKTGSDRYEDCGRWETESYVTHDLEFTQDGQVCAGPCEDHDGEKMCSYVEWDKVGNEESPKSRLFLKLGACGEETSSSWYVIAIVLGAIVAAVILIAIIGLIVAKLNRRKYDQTSTTER